MNIFKKFTKKEVNDANIEAVIQATILLSNIDIVDNDDDFHDFVEQLILIIMPLLSLDIGVHNIRYLKNLRHEYFRVLDLLSNNKKDAE